MGDERYERYEPLGLSSDVTSSSLAFFDTEIWFAVNFTPENVNEMPCDASYAIISSLLGRQTDSVKRTS